VAVVGYESAEYLLGGNSGELAGKQQYTAACVCAIICQAGEVCIHMLPGNLFSAYTPQKFVTVGA